MSTVDEVLALTLTGPLTPIEWVEPVVSTVPVTPDESVDDNIITH